MANSNYTPPSYDLGTDWGTIVSDAEVPFKGKKVKFHKTVQPDINTPASWTVTTVY
jgi:hypothetical protein